MARETDLQIIIEKLANFIAEIRPEQGNYSPDILAERTEAQRRANIENLPDSPAFRAFVDDMQDADVEYFAELPPAELYDEFNNFYNMEDSGPNERPERRRARVEQVYGGIKCAYQHYLEDGLIDQAGFDAAITRINNEINRAVRMRPDWNKIMDSRLIARMMGRDAVRLEIARVEEVNGQAVVPFGRLLNIALDMHDTPEARLANNMTYNRLNNPAAFRAYVQDITTSILNFDPSVLIGADYSKMCTLLKDPQTWKAIYGAYIAENELINLPDVRDMHLTQEQIDDIKAKELAVSFIIGKTADMAKALSSPYYPYGDWEHGFFADRESMESLSETANDYRNIIEEDFGGISLRQEMIDDPVTEADIVRSSLDVEMYMLLKNSEAPKTIENYRNVIGAHKLAKVTSGADTFTFIRGEKKCASWKNFTRAVNTDSLKEIGRIEPNNPASLANKLKSLRDSLKETGAHLVTNSDQFTAMYRHLDRLVEAHENAPDPIGVRDVDAMERSYNELMTKVDAYLTYKTDDIPKRPGNRAYVRHELATNLKAVLGKAPQLMPKARELARFADFEKDLELHCEKSMYFADMLNKRGAWKTVPANPRGLNITRMTASSLAFCLMLEKGYTLEQVLDENNLKDERKEAGRESLALLADSGEAATRRISDVLLNGLEKTVDYADRKITEIGSIDMRVLLKPENRFVNYACYLMKDIGQELNTVVGNVHDAGRGVIENYDRIDAAITKNDALNKIIGTGAEAITAVGKLLNGKSNGSVGTLFGSEILPGKYSDEVFKEVMSKPENEGKTVYQAFCEGYTADAPSDGFEKIFSRKVYSRINDEGCEARENKISKYFGKSPEGKKCFGKILAEGFLDKMELQFDDKFSKVTNFDGIFDEIKVKSPDLALAEPQPQPAPRQGEPAPKQNEGPVPH